MVWLRRGVPEALGTVAIVSAGTSDGPVVREVQRACELLGTNSTVQEDVGVAGLHRLAVALPDLERGGLRRGRRRPGRGARLGRRRARRRRP